MLAQPSDSGMVRVDEETNLGVAVSTDCNGRFAQLDPYAGAQLALAEAYRNVATGGARPLAVSDCLNFGSPEDPGVMWQFAEACRGLKDACVELGIPVTGGNVSLYNQTGETAILPTPVVAVLGVIDDVTRRTPDRLRRGRRSEIVLLGETREELSGSEWAHVVHGHLGGTPPQVDLAAERDLAELLTDAGRAGLLSSRPRPLRRRPRPGAGRVGPATPASAPRSRSRATRSSALFSESAARAIVTVAARRRCAAADMAEAPRRPGHRIGTTGGDALVVEGEFEIPVDELRAAWTATLPDGARRARAWRRRHPRLGRRALLGVRRRPCWPAAGRMTP